jgi:hypothetical protein
MRFSEVTAVPPSLLHLHRRWVTSLLRHICCGCVSGRKVVFKSPAVLVKITCAEDEDATISIISHQFLS